EPSRPRVLARGRAVLALPVGEGPHPMRIYHRRVHLHDTAGCLLARRTFAVCDERHTRCTKKPLENALPKSQQNALFWLQGWTSANFVEIFDCALQQNLNQQLVATISQVTTIDSSPKD